MAKPASRRAKRDPAKTAAPKGRAGRGVAFKAGAEPSQAKPPSKASRSASARVMGVPLTHPNRVLWEETGLTKQGLATFYARIADWILPHVVHRPLALVRCPSGAGKGCFFQKHSWAGLSEHIPRAIVPGGGGEEEVLMVRGIEGVIALVQAGVLEIHPWGSSIADIEHPDRLVFDFDPGVGVPWSAVIEAAREVRARLKDLGLESFPKMTGGKGLHVVAPLAPRADWGAAKSFARALAEAMEADRPGLYLTKATKRGREGRIFIDYLRNARGATAVAAYSTRARPGAPVATPLAWDELAPTLEPNAFTVANLPARLETLPVDPWAEFFTLKQFLPDGSLPRRQR